MARQMCGVARVESDGSESEFRDNCDYLDSTSESQAEINPSEPVHTNREISSNCRLQQLIDGESVRWSLLNDPNSWKILAGRNSFLKYIIPNPAILAKLQTLTYPPYILPHVVSMAHPDPNPKGWAGFLDR